MKSTLSEKYYRDHWNEFMKPVNKGYDYMNLEKDLEERMKIYDGVGLTEEAIEKIRLIEAERIADTCKKNLYKTMNMIQKINRGEVGLGYTTQFQETQERHRLITRFEFNCLQYADFKKKYAIA